MSKVAAMLMALALGAVHEAGANDRWEYVAYNSWDDDLTTLNFLQHGARQTQHDLEFSVGTGTNDQDWYALKTTARHSYEARVNGGIMFWGPAGGCPAMRLMGPGGATLGFAQIAGEDVSTVVTHGGQSKTVGLGVTSRWFAGPTTGVQFLDVNGDPQVEIIGPQAFYDITFRDTTYTVPRWNNSGNQVSIFLIQNTTPYFASATLHLFDSAGTLLDSYVFGLPPQALHVFNSTSLGTLVGKSGSALLTHTGSYGALAGKVVSVETSTGFTFDTPIAPIPY